MRADGEGTESGNGAELRAGLALAMAAALAAALLTDAGRPPTSPPMASAAETSAPHVARVLQLYIESPRPPADAPLRTLSVDHE
jgi:hypothetical protein